MKHLFFISAILFVALLAACKKEDDTKPLQAAIRGNTFEILAGDSIVFKDSSSGRVSRWSWEFEGGQPGASELSSPMVVYNTPGTYSVILTVSDANGSNTVKKEGLVKVGYNKVVAGFSADKLVAQQGDSVHFKDFSTGLPSAWKWEFKEQESGLIITSTQRNPAIKFDQPGKYTVTLKASNAAYQDVAVKELYLEVIDITFVSANFTSNTTATYAGGKVAFYNTSLGTATSYSWTFEGGSPSVSSEADPQITYSSPGRYKVKLTVANPSKQSEKEIDAYILVVPSGNLLAFFPFNNNANDAGPLSVQTTPTGSVAFAGADRNGQAGAAGYFDGSSGLYLQSAGIFNIGTSDFTVSGWFKTNGATRMMLWQESGKNGSADNQSWLRLNDNTTTQYMRFNTEYSGGSSILNLASEGKVNVNSWYHIVAVRNGTKMSVYINGTKVKELTTPEARNITGADQGFKIGFQQGATSFSNFYNGYMDDLLIYKRALTDAEIAALYNL